MTLWLERKLQSDLEAVGFAEQVHLRRHLRYGCFNLSFYSLQPTLKHLRLG